MRYSKKHIEIILKELTNAQDSFDLITITGPTCTGKTDLSLALAQELNIPIINADSRLIFAEMNIGTAKPSLEELAMAKHYLINIKKPNESYSAGEYRKNFDQVILELKAKSKDIKRALAIVVGGTGFYLSSAMDNLDMPEVSKNEELRAELNSQDLDTLIELMYSLDPEAYKEVDIKNKIRVIRAIEILKTTNKTLAEARGFNFDNRYKVISFALNFSQRSTLYDLINARVNKMINLGLVEEVEALVKKYGVTETLLSTIGYREIIAYLNQECTLSEACNEIQKRTRQYAKRQMTWFKKKRDIIWLNADENLISS